MFIERYSHVMHIVSQVEGRIAADKTAFDLMRATFPAGTVSGAPKIRAMQIIAEKEPVQRASIPASSATSATTATSTPASRSGRPSSGDGLIHIQAGGGVVADSSPFGRSTRRRSQQRPGRSLKAVEIASRF